MKTKTGRIMTWMGLWVFAAAILPACAANRVSLSDVDQVKVQVLPSSDKYVGISKADVYQDGSELVVTGTATKRGPLFTTYKGHVDVAVIGPDGEPAKLGTAEYRHHPSRHRTKSFAVRFPVSAEKGAEVRLVFHRTNGADSKHAEAVKTLLSRAK